MAARELEIEREVGRLHTSPIRRASPDPRAGAPHSPEATTPSIPASSPPAASPAAAAAAFGARRATSWAASARAPVSSRRGGDLDCHWQAASKNASKFFAIQQGSTCAENLLKARRGRRLIFASFAASRGDCDCLRSPCSKGGGRGRGGGDAGREGIHAPSERALVQSAF